MNICLVFPTVAVGEDLCFIVWPSYYNFLSVSTAWVSWIFSGLLECVFIYFCAYLTINIIIIPIIIPIITMIIILINFDYNEINPSFLN